VASLGRVLLSLLLFILPCCTVAQNNDLRGFADMHSHEFANEAFGGYVVTGLPYGPMSDALSEARDRAGHSNLHAFDILGGYLAGYGGAITYPNDGFPNFTGWPSFFEVSHQKVHEEFLKRAVDGGLHLMVMMAVESPLLCDAIVNGGGRTDGRDCNDEMSGIKRQIADAVAMQNYIDAEAGGPNLGWYRIVTTPDQARDVIRAGKLAVVLGVETSHLFNCHHEPCDWSGPLDELWALGVRHFFPIHQDKNAFGGPSYFQTSVQNGPALLNVKAYTFPTVACNYTFPNKTVTRGGGQCDALGLTATGKAFVAKLMNLGAVIDVDHMSDHSFADTLTIAEQLSYPVVASHAGLNAIQQRQGDHEGQLTDAELARVRDVGGMIGLLSDPGDIYSVGTYKGNGPKIPHICGRSSETFAQPYLYALEHAPGMAIGVGTDFNGPLRQLGPRFGAYACNGERAAGPDSINRLPSSFLARASNTVLTPFKTGNRTWDFNQDGLAHVGLLPDLIADLEVLGIPENDLEPLLYSAKGYVDVWQRAVDHSGRQLPPPEPPIAMASSDGGLQMMLDRSGRVWARNAFDGDWTLESPAGEVAISAGAGGLQVLLDSAGQVWAKNSIGYGNWVQESPGGEKAIAAGGNGLQMLLDGAGQVWAKNSIGDGGWNLESPGGEKAIAAGGSGLQMLLDGSGQVWAKYFVGNGGWNQESPAGEVAIAAGGNGLQMLLDGVGQVWAKNFVGNGGWSLESPAGEKAISAGDSNLQMICDGVGQVWAKNFIGNGGWSLESPAGEKAIAAGDNNLQMIFDGAGQVWAKNFIGNGGWNLEPRD
jgi:microsomal dipeptidase-like Zn-dependent dipeptidase/uncharacterized protein (AIM24 family)